MKQSARLLRKKERAVKVMADKIKKPENKKKQFIIFGLCSFVALILCMITLVVVVNRVEAENSKMSTSATKESKTVLSENPRELSEYLSELTVNAKGNKFIKADKFTEISIDESTVKIFGEKGKENSNDIAIFNYINDYILSYIDPLYGDDVVGEFGKINENLPEVTLGENNAVEGVIYTGQHDDNGNPVLDENGDIIDGDLYFITLTILGETVDSALDESLNTDVYPHIKASLEKELSSYCKIEKIDSVRENYTVYAKVNRLTDELVNLEICRNFLVEADITFINELNIFGEKNITFNYTIADKYDYYYAGVDLLESEITLSEGDEINLTVNAVIEDDSDYEVIFSSSDEAIATVDEMGYVKGIKASEEPVTVTVTLRYMGETFTDHCLVYVGDGSN